MQFISHRLPGVIECVPKKFEDERGHFYESYNQMLFRANGISDDFVQDNYSYSIKGVIRGLHFQKNPHAQSKLVRCMKGAVLDVVLDLRQSSPTYGQFEMIPLDADKGNMLYVPMGFAHGFLALEDTIFVYKCNKFWNKEHESGIRFDDPNLQIPWNISEPIVSDKDRILPLFDPNEALF